MNRVCIWILTVTLLVGVASNVAFAASHETD
jgi:hypothetical protein